MAINNDPQAKGSSLPYPKPNSAVMLSGDRWSFQANQDFIMPASSFNESDEKSVMTATAYFVEQHYRWQVPRLLTLERYYRNENDIHFWKSTKVNRADNRIANGIARYITNIRVGYQYGNPIKYIYDDPHDPEDSGQDIIDALEQFNDNNDEPFHNKIMGESLCNTGRAYELMYVKEGTHQVLIKEVDPANAFVVYDATINHNPLFGVRYYMISFDEVVTFYYEVYTPQHVYYFKADSEATANLSVDKKREDHVFGGVPLIEYNLNNERVGLWEPDIDIIDALDKALSEMTNSQEDISNAILINNVNHIKAKSATKISMNPARIELATYSLGNCCSILLS